MAHVPVDKKSNSILPPLLEIFPPETYPLREIGTGFTAQSAQGDDANACAAIALDMMLETRGTVYSAASSDGGSSMMDVEPFAVPDLPLPEDAAEDGLLILRNERLFPGMVGISLPMRGILWVREDGTFNCSGFFRRQIPKFETAALVAAVSNMAEFCDVYHSLYRPVVEAAALKKQFKVLRTVLEAGLRHYKDDCPARTELTELRMRIIQLRTQTKDSPKTLKPALGEESTANVMESRRRSSGSAAAAAGSGSGSSSGIDDSYPGRSTPLNSCDYSDGGAGVDGCGGMGADGSGKELRACRSVSKTDSDASERSSKIAQQVVTGAPKQKKPFRLWKSDLGKESYDKGKPS